MKSLLTPTLGAAALAASASAQVDYPSQIDSLGSQFTWSATTSVGDVDEAPAAFTLVGDVVMTLDTGGNPVGSGGFPGAGEARLTPDLHGEVPGGAGGAPIFTIDLLDTSVRFSSPVFPVDVASDFSTPVTVEVIAGTLVLDDLAGAQSVTDLAGLVGAPVPTTGEIRWASNRYELVFPIQIGFDFDDPITGISGALLLGGMLRSEYHPTPPAAYCQSSPNSVGAGAQLSASGSTSIGNGDLMLLTTGLPNDQFALHLYSSTRWDVPFGNGTRCIGPSPYRLKPASTGLFGELLDPCQSSLLPAGGDVVVGDVRYFQCWYRDPQAGGAQFNLSNGLSVTFTP